MKIMVFDVAASTGGALTILSEYYRLANKDQDNEWYFVISNPIFDNKENVTIIRFPWVKRSWFHRIYFDFFVAHRLVKRYNIDEVLSLQNVVIPRTNIKQTLYLHQPLPFIEKRFKVFENFKFWLYQNIINKLIFRSIIKANKVIVQTKWMKDACVIKTGVSITKVFIEEIPYDYKVVSFYSNESDDVQFFYPASGLIYKNHDIIIQSCLNLVKSNIAGFKIFFTLTGNENKHIRKIKLIVEKNNLPIFFVGYLDKSQLNYYYSSSILLFPSYIETFGLPLLEARHHKCPIVASDTKFSREVLFEYTQSTFFDPFNVAELTSIMKNHIENNSEERR